MILSKTRQPFVALAVFAVASLVVGATARAQKPKPEGKDKPAAKVAPLTAATVSKRLEELKASSLKDDVKARIKSLYEKAKTKIDDAATIEKSARELQQLKAAAPQLEADAQKKLESPLAPPKVPGVDEFDLKTLESRQTAARAAKEETEKQLKEWTTKQKNRLTRKEIVPKRLLEAKSELTKAEADLKAEPPPGEPAEGIVALRFLQRAQVQALKKEVDALTAELPAYNATDKAVDLQVQAWKHELQRTENLVKYWDQKVEEHRGTEARDQARQASTTVENLSNAKMPTPLIEIAKQNLTLARHRTGESGTVTELREVLRDLNAVEAELKKIESEKTSLEEKLQIPDIEADIGPLLVVQRRRLPNVNHYKRRINERNAGLSQLRLKYINAQGMKNHLKDVRQDVKRQLAAMGDKLDNATRTRADAALQSLLTAREKILDSLLNDYKTLLEQRSQLTARERELIDASSKLHALIDKHILWIPTTLPLGISHLRDTADAVAWLIDPAEWQTTVEKLLDAIFAQPVTSTLIVLLLAFALFKQPLMKRRLDEIGEEASRGFTQPYRLTVKALLLTTLLAAIWPLVMVICGRLLQRYSDTTAFAESVGLGLQAAAWTVFTFEFLRRAFKRNGLADAHFRWKSGRLKVLRRNLRWFMLATLPGVFLYTLIDDFGNEEHVASLGRLILIALLLLAAAFLAIVLRNPQVKLPFSDALGLEHNAAAKPASLWQVIAYLVVVLFPVALAITAIAGYQYTAAFLAWKFLRTAWLGLELLIGHAMAMRWLYYVRGKLAIEQAQAAAAEKKAAEERAAAAAATAQDAPDSPANQALNRDSSNGSVNAPPGEPASPNPPAVTDAATKAPATDLAAINAQTRRLLQIAIGTWAVIGLWATWADVLPALKFLDYPLWSHQAEVTRMVTGPDKTVVPQTIVELKAFTLGKLLITVAIVAVVFVAASNLPGLLEVAILQKLPIDSGARYAVTSLSRYTIYAVGLLMAFNLMGFSWSKIQWLVAALGVGLGFGLQEIVANFVSGIILLFERPLRVGDIVTVGDVSGVVTRIQIRATTVRDWDRKEYIVPNKELVTGKLMNWTLSDTVNRIVVNVGVEYGTDADRVREILLGVANDHPEICADPPALASFEGFGDSSLNFVLRCFLPDMSQRLVVIHQLHAEIQRRLADANIGIPFPQRDLHIRTDETRGNGEAIRERDTEQAMSN